MMLPFHIMHCRLASLIAIADQKRKSRKKEDEEPVRKGAGPLEAIGFHWFFGLAREGQPPFRIGTQRELKRLFEVVIHVWHVNCW